MNRSLTYLTLAAMMVTVTAPAQAGLKPTNTIYFCAGLYGLAAAYFGWKALNAYDNRESTESRITKIEGDRSYPPTTGAERTAVREYKRAAQNGEHIGVFENATPEDLVEPLRNYNKAFTTMKANSTKNTVPTAAFNDQRDALLAKLELYRENQLDTAKAESNSFNNSYKLNKDQAIIFTVGSLVLCGLQKWLNHKRAARGF